MFRMRSNYYNHSIWPSPVAKMVVKNLGLDRLPYGEKIKRITHDQALEVLRRKSGKETIEDFLAMDKHSAWRAIGAPLDYRGHPQNPLYRRGRY